MPLIFYLCGCGKSKSKFFRIAKEAPTSFQCDCGADFKKQLSAPSNASKITVDNGVQGRAVEVDLNIIQSNLDNSMKDFSEE